MVLFPVLCMQLLLMWMCCYDKRLSPVQQNLALTAIVMIGEDHQLIRLSFLIDSLLYIILSQSTYEHYLRHLPPAPHVLWYWWNIAKNVHYGHFQGYWWILVLHFVLRVCWKKHNAVTRHSFVYLLSTQNQKFYFFLF